MAIIVEKVARGALVFSIADNGTRQPNLLSHRASRSLCRSFGESNPNMKLNTSRKKFDPSAIRGNLRKCLQGHA